MNEGKSNGRYKHGESRTAVNSVYRAMLWRCKKHKNYAGRGIKVCARWADPANGFVNFVQDLGPRPDGYTLERRNNNGNYTPTNCYWAPRKVQQRNNRRNHVVTFRGRSQCISAWADEVGVSRKTIQARLANGWSAKRALTTPVR